MRSIVLILLATILCTTLAAKYTDRFDNINLDEILDNKRLLDPYLKCLLEKGRCAPDAKELKIHVREALENDCADCTEKQKSGTRKVIRHLIRKEQDYWKQLKDKYDPEYRYSKKYEDELERL